MTVVRKDSTLRYDIDTNDIDLKNYVRKIAYDTIPSSGIYDSYNAVAEGYGVNYNSTNDSLQLAWDGSSRTTVAPGVGVGYYIMGFTMQSTSPDYGATYSNSTVSWAIGADSSLSLHVIKNTTGTADYYVAFYKHLISAGANVAITAGTLLYRQQVSASFFASNNWQKITVRFRR